VLLELVGLVMLGATFGLPVLCYSLYHEKKNQERYNELLRAQNYYLRWKLGIGEDEWLNGVESKSAVWDVMTGKKPDPIDVILRNRKR
jgi:hypothetical protein